MPQLHTLLWQIGTEEFGKGLLTIGKAMLGIFGVVVVIYLVAELLPRILKKFPSKNNQAVNTDYQVSLDQLPPPKPEDSSGIQSESSSFVEENIDNSNS